MGLQRSLALQPIREGISIRNGDILLGAGLRRLSGLSSQWAERDRGPATSRFCRAGPWSHVQTAHLPRGIKAIPTNLVFTFKPQWCSEELQWDWPSGGILCEQVACRSLPSRRWDRHKPRTVTRRHLRGPTARVAGLRQHSQGLRGATALPQPRARLHLQPRPSQVGAGPFARNLLRFLERARCNQTKPRQIIILILNYYHFRTLILNTEMGTTGQNNLSFFIQ